MPSWSLLEADWARTGADRKGWFRAGKAFPSLKPNLEPCGSGCRCPAFTPETNQCSIYSERPLDCRIYPFTLSRDSAGSRILLSMDMKCPYLQEHASDPEVAAYAVELARYLDSPAGREYLSSNPDIVGPTWPEFVSVAPMTGFRALLQRPKEPPHPRLTPFTWGERGLLEEVLSRSGSHAHSSYSLAGLLGWSDIVHYWWVSLEGMFCLFAEQAGGLFMPIPPLGAGPKGRTLGAAWKILQAANGKESAVSRIEGIELSALPAFEGWSTAPGAGEYLYQREDLVSLRGDRYRSQRHAVNQCVRAFRKRGSVPFLFRPFEEKDLLPCLQLYTLWGIQRQREAGEADLFPRALVRDGLFFHRRLMMSRRELGMTGRVLEAEGRIRGYTFGAPISSDVFCVFLEIADRSVPGLNALLFRELCREVDRWPLINAMGDDDLPGLRRAKLSYRPSGFARTWTAIRPD